ncbi:MAG: RidA family protein [Steroidobacteraceae bacterium]
MTSTAYDPGDSRAYGFSPAVHAAGLVFVAGQVGLEPDGSVPQDPERQYRLAFAALGNVLQAEGCDVADIVELMSFHTIYPAHMDVFMKVKAEFQRGALPAWTAVGVAALGLPGTLVEIKAIAREGARGGSQRPMNVSGST